MADNNRGRYTAVAISLHWLVFALVLAAWSLGLYMVDLPLSPQKLKYFSWHKWIGVTIFLFATARLAGRFVHPAPPLPLSVPAWQRSAAYVSYALLYVLILAIPISGWLFSSASGVPVVYFGELPLPNPVEKDKELAEFLKQIHIFLNWTLFVIVCVHVLAALKHHIVDRDDVLARMLPIIKPRRE